MAFTRSPAISHDQKWSFRFRSVAKYGQRPGPSIFPGFVSPRRSRYAPDGFLVQRTAGDGVEPVSHLALPLVGVVLVNKGGLGAGPAHADRRFSGGHARVGGRGYCRCAGYRESGCSVPRLPAERRCAQLQDHHDRRCVRCRCPELRSHLPHRDSRCARRHSSAEAARNGRPQDVVFGMPLGTSRRFPAHSQAHHAVVRKRLTPALPEPPGITMVSLRNHALGPLRDTRRREEPGRDPPAALAVPAAWCAVAHWLGRSCKTRAGVGWRIDARFVQTS
jgi:hypothetical protein